MTSRVRTKRNTNTPLPPESYTAFMHERVRNLGWNEDEARLWADGVAHFEKFYCGTSWSQREICEHLRQLVEGYRAYLLHRYADEPTRKNQQRFDHRLKAVKLLCWFLHVKGFIAADCGEGLKLLSEHC